MFVFFIVEVMLLGFLFVFLFLFLNLKMLRSPKLNVLNIFTIFFSAL